MPDGYAMHDKPQVEPWPAPDMSVLTRLRRPAPMPPLMVLEDAWATWVRAAADAAACPPDYVLGALLALASTLIGNARWARATPGWQEPPHLWIGDVGDSGTGKSPGSDALLGSVLAELERRMQGDFPDRHAEWQAEAKRFQAETRLWEGDVEKAVKDGNTPPLPPVNDPGSEPQAPRVRQNDVTVERIAALLANTAPKGLLIVRDELAGWLRGMNTYNDAGRAFWLEAYGGRPYRQERVKHPHPIEVARLTVAVFGGTQPERLAELMAEPDDGLLARIQWIWPEPVPFRLGNTAPNIDFAIRALDRLRLLDMMPCENGPQPVIVPLAADALGDMEAFARDMQAAQSDAAGLMRSAFGKARGTALRLSLVLEYLWWCARDDMPPPPMVISRTAFAAAATLVADYLMPMAERTYGDAATPETERHAHALAKWVFRTRPAEVHVRKLQREVRLPRLRDAETIKAACDALVDAGWLREPKVGFGAARKVAYSINPSVWEPAP